jgi:hypothetical protein
VASDEASECGPLSSSDAPQWVWLFRDGHFFPPTPLALLRSEQRPLSASHGRQFHAFNGSVILHAILTTNKQASLKPFALSEVQRCRGSQPLRPLDHVHQLFEPSIPGAEIKGWYTMKQW